MYKHEKQLDTLLGVESNYDVVKRIVGNRAEYTIYFLASLASGNTIIPLIESLVLTKEILKEKIYIGSIKEENNIDKIAVAVLNGESVLCPKDKKDSVLIIETRSYPTRGINEPETEKTIRGSKDGFVESIIVNTALIRRRIKSLYLCTNMMEVGTSSKTHVCIVYMKERAKKESVEYIKDKISSLDADSLIMTDRALEEMIFKQRLNVYPLVRYTERPDIASIQILKGHIVILVDNSASVIITPTTLFEHMRHIEEYRQTPIVGSFTRIIRMASIILSVVIVPLWLALVKDETFKSILFLVPKNELAIPLFVQIIIAELMLEVVRIATIHTPSSLTSAIGLIAALLIGQLAVDLQVFVPEILLYTALSAIGGFATPSYELSLANKIVKVGLIVLVGVLGKIGFILGLIFIFLYLVSIKIFDSHYLSPFIPFNFKQFKNIILRIPEKNDTKGVK